MTPFPPTDTASPTLPPTDTETPTAEPTAALPTEAPVTPSLPPEPTAEPLARATALPDPGAYEWQPVVSGLQSPTSLAHAGDGSGRIFVVEQGGVIRILQEGVILPGPFLDISSKVTAVGNEQGLLGLAFHPNFTQNGFFYVNYTRRPDGATVIARYQTPPVDPASANLAPTDPATEKQLLVIPQPYANHNGGAVEFGPDGYLYLALGDGGAAGDPHDNGQNTDSLLGKILRIDVDGGDPYAIPPDNPFANGGGASEVWAYGLRNPWRITFDRQTNEVYIADVGQNQWEEINHLPANASGELNFGWNIFEGSHPYSGGDPPAGVTLIAPVAEYSHAEGGCSVTGGVVVRDVNLPAWQGVYLYGDYCTGNVWGLLSDGQGGWTSGLLYSNVGRITSFGEDEAGQVYLLDRMGIIYRLVSKS
jgi:glucose/arabinose dehydrogenase